MIILQKVKASLDYNLEELKEEAAKMLCINAIDIKDINILRRETKAKDVSDVHFEFSLELTVHDEERLTRGRGRSGAQPYVRPTYSIPNVKLEYRPIIIGFGPAGMFASLLLAEAGARPIVLERGLDADQRQKSVSDFWIHGKLDKESNIQFGEGGAGAFSDGKLKTGKKDARKLKILDELINAGAPEEIAYLGMPHIGTDKLHIAIKGIREKIKSFGGEIIFDARATEIITQNVRVEGVHGVSNGKEFELITNAIIVAPGQSARDTYEMLIKAGCLCEQKNFAVGVRLEHPQSHIDRLKYGDFAGHNALGAASYRAVVHLPNGRGVYTFCMCPGGSVVAASSDVGCVVTNGMSQYARDGENANAALLVTVEPGDLLDDSPLAGLDFRHNIERAAYLAGGGGYKAPVQLLGDFMEGKMSYGFGCVSPTYMPGTAFAPVDEYLPGFAVRALHEAVLEIEDWMPGFYLPEAVITGAETRSVSPIRIVRENTLEARWVKGLYPCGEGAGYSGGIISAAVDGMKCAESILSK